MDKLAVASINSFGLSPEADVPPEESIFVLTSSQLQEIISRTVQPLQEHILALEDRAIALEEDNTVMSRKIASLETLQEQDTTRICLDIAYDRRRLAALEKIEPQPLQRDRGEILRALIAANGGKILAKDARLKMHLSKQTFSMLLASMVDYIEIKPLHSDKRKLLLIIK
jgi:hypothetical protein